LLAQAGCLKNFNFYLAFRISLLLYLFSTNLTRSSTPLSRNGLFRTSVAPRAEALVFR
jgi:hypothetical protein